MRRNRFEQEEYITDQHTIINYLFGIILAWFAGLGVLALMLRRSPDTLLICIGACTGLAIAFCINGYIMRRRLERLDE